jgi:hypothetical protein
MKKTKTICLMLIFVLSIGCKNTADLCPKNFPLTKWVCAEYDVFFTVYSENSDNGCNGKIEINGEICEFVLYFAIDDVYSARLVSNSPKKLTLFGGDCKYYEDKCEIKILTVEATKFDFLKNKKLIFVKEKLTDYELSSAT